MFRLLRRLFSKLIRKFRNPNYKKRYVLIKRNNEIESELIDTLRLPGVIDTHYQLHEKFPEYCLNYYGLKRKIRFDKNNLLYYIERSIRYYLAG